MGYAKNQFHPILSVVVNTATAEERESIERMLEALLREDAGIKIKVESVDGKLLICGEDELQMEIIRERILRAHRVEIGELQVVYQETIRKAAEAEGKYIRQTGGSGNYGHCKLRVEPNTPGAGYEFINDIKGGVVPKEYIKPIDQGVQGALELGIMAGFPIVDVKVTLYDGSYHEVDSNEMAFKFAGSIAFKEAARKAQPVLLEPVMAVEVTVPEEFMGVIIGDINSRRGRVLNIEQRDGALGIHAFVPLAEVLRSSVHGRSQYAMRFAGYEAGPRRDGSNGADLGIYAKKPNGPTPRTGSAFANSDPI